MKDIKDMEVINPYGFIYITTNMVNGKKYIGQKTFKKDWEVYLGSGILLTRAINKYGIDNFSREIIALAYSKEELNKLEIIFIENHNATESDDYYNIAPGGYGGAINVGNHHSQETKNKISTGNKGKVVSKESKLKMSNSRIGEKNPNYGKHFSKESKQKMSESSRKINTIQEIEIREKYASGKYKMYKLAEEYLVALSVISNVVNYKRAYKIV